MHDGAGSARRHCSHLQLLSQKPIAASMNPSVSPIIRAFQNYQMNNQKCSSSSKATFSNFMVNQAPISPAKNDGVEITIEPHKDQHNPHRFLTVFHRDRISRWMNVDGDSSGTVSYTHLTLPTILLV